jgi:hypothetical protein
MGPVELAECFPVPGVRFGVVGRVVGHRESVVGGVGAGIWTSRCRIQL